MKFFKSQFRIEESGINYNSSNNYNNYNNKNNNLKYCHSISSCPIGNIISETSETATMEISATITKYIATQQQQQQQQQQQ
jgi:hypothetical protein